MNGSGVRCDSGIMPRVSGSLRMLSFGSAHPFVVWRTALGTTRMDRCIVFTTVEMSDASSSWQSYADCSRQTRNPLGKMMRRITMMAQIQVLRLFLTFTLPLAFVSPACTYMSECGYVLLVRNDGILRAYFHVLHKIW